MQSLSAWAARFELLAGGVDGHRKDAIEALQNRQWLDARQHARALLREVPKSRLGLAILAEATESAWLLEESASALEALEATAPWDGAAVVRLGIVLCKLGDARARETLERAVALELSSQDLERALFALADLSTRAGEPVRARHWLSRVPKQLSSDVLGLRLRQAEALLAERQFEQAAALAALLPEVVGDEHAGESPDARMLARASRLQAELALEGQSRDLEQDLLRAYLLCEFGADEPFAVLLLARGIVARKGECPRIRRLLVAAGLLEEPEIKAALLLCEGRPREAGALLLEPYLGGRFELESLLFGAISDARDLGALHRVVDHGRAPRDPRLVAIEIAARHLSDGNFYKAVRGLCDVEGASPWIDELAEQAALGLLRTDRLEVLRLLGQAVKTLDLGESGAAFERLQNEGDRPVSLSVMGEFNAGKSTFINALLGSDVLPTGIVPTTSDLHILRFGPDAIARVLLADASEVLVSHANLRGVAEGLRARGDRISRVIVHAPLPLLAQIELVDTPGFNAPDPTHAERASEALEESDVVLWLVDGASPMKATEAARLREIAERRIPILVLVNKSDRVPVAARDHLMATVATALSEMGVKPEFEPMLFSAKGGGDESFEAVQKVLLGHLLARAEVYRRIRFVRRLRSLLGLVRGPIAVLAAEEVARRAREREATAGHVQAVTLALGNLGGFARALRERVGRHELGLRAELAPLATEGEREGEPPPERELEFLRYAAERWVSVLGGPILRELGIMLSVPPYREASAVIASSLESIAFSFPPRIKSDAEREHLWGKAVATVAHAYLTGFLRAHRSGDPAVEEGAQFAPRARLIEVLYLALDKPEKVVDSDP